MLAITLNERITGNFTEAGVCSLSLAEFKRFIKTWIEPAADPAGLKNQLETYLQKYGCNIKEARKKLLVLSGAKSKKTEATKAITFISKQDYVELMKTEEKYLLTDSHMLIELSDNDIREAAKTNIVLQDLLTYTEKYPGTAARYIKSDNDIREGHSTLPALFQKCIDHQKRYGSEMDFTAGKYTIKKNKYDVSAYTCSGVSLNEVYLNLFKDKKYIADPEKPYSPVYKEMETCRVILCGVRLAS